MQSSENLLFHRNFGKGSATLLVHPYIMNGSVWDDVLQHLPKGRRYIVPDLAGHGRSDPPFDGKVAPDEDALRLARLLEQVAKENPVDVVGVAAGGLVAAHLASEFGKSVRSLALVSTPLITQEIPGQEIAMHQAANTLLMEGKDSFRRQSAAYLFSPQASPYARARYATMLDECPYETIISVMLGKATKGRPQLCSKLHCPVLIAHTPKDPAVPPAAIEQLQKDIADARFATIPGGGRMTPLEAPEELAHLLAEFWSELDER